MPFTYHPGELAVQKRAGVEVVASRMVKTVHSHIPPIAQEFLRNQPIVFMGSVDFRGGVWASVLIGQPGFVRSVDDHHIHIETGLSQDDPLSENLYVNPNAALLAVEFPTHRRMRANGKAVYSAIGIDLFPEEVYSNCGRYIHERTPSFTDTPDTLRQVHIKDFLLPEQQRWISESDTFFIASAHSDGADVSHKGGQPGFVQVLGEHTLLFPDYNGNRMFNTLGNITVNPKAGLLFCDFNSGNTLQLSGHAEIIWEQYQASISRGAERYVKFHVEQGIEMRRTSSF